VHPCQNDLSCRLRTAVDHQALKGMLDDAATLVHAECPHQLDLLCQRVRYGIWQYVFGRLEMKYVQEDDGVWCDPSESADLAYSDGDEEEERILRAVRHASDLSSLSEELQSALVDWPSEYHLSRQRHLLVRPLEIARGQSVLELGSGAGAITRYLGECGAHVDAVEGSRRRARIAAARTSDLPNVRVFHDDILTFESERRYDWILLVGVLEYAPMFLPGASPAADLLLSVRGRLAPEGHLAVAIENRLGLKYFNGFNEDHLGVARVGIENRYRPGQPTTYSKDELRRLLQDAGFGASTFLLPFPDYKLPSVIVSEEAFDAGAKVADLVRSVRSHEYAGRPVSSFNESLVRYSIAESRLLAELANSFLVVSAASGVSAWEPPAIAWSYSLGSRRTGLACETTFVTTDSGLAIEKRRLDGQSGPVQMSGVGIIHAPSSSLFSEGRQLASKFMEALCRSDVLSVRAVVDEFVTRYLSLLKEASGQGDLQGATLLENWSVDGSYFDFIPRNILVDADGALSAFIDDEWQSQSAIPAHALAFRAGIDLAQVVEAVHPGLGLDGHVWDSLRDAGLSDELREEYQRDESAFQQAVNIENQSWSTDHQSTADASTVIAELVVERDRLMVERDGLAVERDGLMVERDWWFGQFLRLRRRRSVRFALRFATLVARLRRAARRS